MAILQISTLGPFVASLNNEPIYSFKTQKVQALLIYLLVENDHLHSRESLMELLWPDMPLESAQVNLRQTIYRLRQAIPGVNAKGSEKQVPLLQASRHTLGLNPEAEVSLDINEFRTTIVNKPEQAVSLYRGDFLADFYLSDSNNFEYWAEQIRQNLQREVLETLSDLVDRCIEKDRFDKAQQFAWRQLEIDNMRESAYRQLMVALAGSGQRNAALSQFQLCQSRLEKELKLKPSQETLDLYEKIQVEALSQVKEASTEKTKPAGQTMPVFLLTDIEGSTRLWDQYHEAMLSALFAHNRILEDRISQYGGRILELRGDGVKAVFESGNPLESVIRIQKDFNQTDWGEIGSLKVRMGLHGLPTIRKGYDYFLKDDQYYGPVLNHTARIMDSGWGGQILVSEQVRNVCSLPREARWKDHGFHEIKSLEVPINIFELTHPNLGDGGYPPLRTLSNQPDISVIQPIKSKVSNLPPQLTPFIGRTKELSRLEQFLSDSDTRLITIVGAGGMGKTRLAIALAERGTEHADFESFPDGIYFVPLAPLVSADQIVTTIISSLAIPVDIPQTTDRSSQVETDLKESLLNFLMGKNMLIILDNFEHLLDGADLVSNILETCSNIHIIITSRERLNLQEEQIFPIHGLEYPDWEAPESPGDFTAMELFLQSARRNKPDFNISNEEMVPLTRICKLIGGMPLGLELAAAWVDMLSMEEIAKEIKKSLDFLESDIRNIPERHRSIRAVFESSWQYLSLKEREIFPRFSVFRGGFGRDAAQSVTGASIKDLASFVNKSMIQYDESGGCYQIHELLRQYGEEQLKTNPNNELNTRDNHSQYYSLSVRDQIDRSLKTGDLLAFHYIEDNYSNILEAWNWSIHQENVINVDLAIDGLSFYYDWNWQDKDGLILCQTAVKMLSEKRNHPKRTKGDTPRDEMIDRVFAKARCFEALFNLYSNIGHAYQLLEESKSIIRTLQNNNISADYENANCLFFLGVAKFHLEDPNSSKRFFKESLASSEKINFEFLVLRNLNALGDIARSSGKPRQAKEWYQKSLTRARLNNNKWGEMIALNSLGWAARILMDYERARQIYTENRVLSQKYNNPFEEIRAIESLGFLSIFLGDFSKASKLFIEAVRISTTNGIQHQAIASKVHIAVSNWLAGNFTEAEPVFESAVTLAKKLNPSALIFPGTCKAEFMVMVGNYHRARDQLLEIKTMVDQVYTDRFLSGRLSRTLGWLAIVERDYSKAENYFKESIALYQAITDDKQIAWSQAGLARALFSLGKLEQAQDVLTDALWTAIELKAFIPILFILPVSVLLLVRDDQKLASDINQLIQSSPFLANAQFFKDTIDPYLPSKIKHPLQEPVPTQDEIKDLLWKAASSVMSNWMQLWIEENDTVSSHQIIESKDNGTHS